VSRLQEILATKRREIEALRGASRACGATARDPLDVVAALRRSSGAGAGSAGALPASARVGALRLVTEVKLRSPSAGSLSRALTPGARAVAYAREGAAMVSVLCDGPFFDGAWEHLQEARAAIDGAGLAVPLLAKEFVLDRRQIEEARDRGADAVLLIARIVDAAALRALVHAARDEGIEPLVEVVDETELASALDAGARVVGVNARDLDTLAMDAARASRVLASIPGDVVAVHFSGLKSAADVASVARGRADAALVGETLMRRDDPGPLLRELVDASTTPRDP
jgi:indole-3-glycerol phosphate synthase